MSNASRRTGRTAAKLVTINHMEIEILPFAAELKYLARTISFDKQHEVKIDARVATAWKIFMARRKELTNKTYTVNSRMKLFESTVGASILYGCEAWTLTKKLETKIMRTQRKMMRMIVGCPRRKISDDHPEPWVDWIRRATRRAEQCLQKLGLQEWTSTATQRKLNWAKRVATMENERWAFRCASWTPEWHNCRRQQGRPFKRWHESLGLGQDWLTTVSV